MRRRCKTARHARKQAILPAARWIAAAAAVLTMTSANAVRKIADRLA